MRLNQYTEGGATFIKLRLKTHSATEKILTKTYRLRDFEQC